MYEIEKIDWPLSHSAENYIQSRYAQSLSKYFVASW